MVKINRQGKTTRRSDYAICSACGTRRAVNRAGLVTTRHAPCPGAGRPPAASGE